MVSLFKTSRQQWSRYVQEADDMIMHNHQMAIDLAKDHGEDFMRVRFQHWYKMELADLIRRVDEANK